MKLEITVRQTEKVERAVKASHSRRAPNPGGAVQMNRNLDRRPRKTKLVHLGRQAQPITSPIITASHIGTAHSKMSTNVSVIVGFFKNSIRSKNDSSILSRENQKPNFRGLFLIGETIDMDLCINGRFRSEHLFGEEERNKNVFYFVFIYFLIGGWRLIDTKRIWRGDVKAVDDLMVLVIVCESRGFVEVAVHAIVGEWDWTLEWIAYLIDFGIGYFNILFLKLQAYSWNAREWLKKNLIL